MRKEKDKDYNPQTPQKSLMQYTLRGKPGKFFQEQKLRDIASGKGSFAAFIGRAFGESSGLGKLVGKLEKKPTQEEKKQAKETLEKEYGVKFADEKRRGKSEFVGIIKTLVGMKTMIKDISKNVNEVLGVSNSILGKLNELKNVKASRTDMPSLSDLTPQTIMQGEKEYLYYEGAPENRKFYEKGKKGTAGKIASKKVQKKLVEKVQPTATKKSAVDMGVPSMPADAIEKIISQSSESTLQTVTKILSERVPAQENDIRDLLLELAKGDESQKMELDEQQEMLKGAMKTALEEVLKENPELLEQKSGGIIGKITGLIGGLSKMLGMGKLAGTAGTILDGATGKGAPEIPDTKPDTAAKKGKGFLGKAGKFAKGLLGKAALPLAGAMAAYDAYKGFQANQDAPLSERLKNAGSSALSGITFGLLGSSPEEIEAQKAAATTTAPAAAIPSMAAISAQQKPATTYSEGLAQIASASPGMMTNQIVAMNRENELLRASMSRPDAGPAAPIVNNITNSMSVPIKQDKQITTSNMENTFNRLMMQDIDHPVTFSNVYMS